MENGHPCRTFLILGIDQKDLEETVKKFSQYVGGDKDPGFHCGDSTNDRIYNDSLVKPNPNLAPLTKPPYYSERY